MMKFLPEEIECAIQLLKEKKMQACFVNSESPPIVVEHICWYVTQRYDGEKRTNMLDLNEMVKETYPHPDAPDDAVVSVITNRLNKSVRLENGAELLLLKSACDTVSKLNNETVIPRPLSSENEMSDI